MLIERYRPKPHVDLSPMLYWCEERELIRQKKEAGLAPPWTKDEILATYRFCNMRRRDDRVSQWLIKNLLTNASNQFSEWSFIQMVALGRWINWPNTLIAMHDEGLWPRPELNLEEIGEFLDTLDNKVWTGAYMIRAPDGVYKNMGKGLFISSIVVGNGLESVRPALLQAIKDQSLEGTWKALSEALYWGSFMSQQVTSDLSYTPLLRHPHDLFTWAAVGPGSARGFNRLMGRPLTTAINEAEWLPILIEWRSQIISKLGPAYEDLPLTDVTNVLCEVDKYLRVKNGEGRPRSIYRSHAGLY